jgi:DNA-binding PadR family transcriptional regulator
MKGNEFLAREQFQTLSEPMYYILLALLKECCGVEIMKRVSEISNDRIAIGPGTLYALLQKFEENKIIIKTKSTGRMQWYLITDFGMELLNDEYNRLQIMCKDKDMLKED